MSVLWFCRGCGGGTVAGAHLLETQLPPRPRLHGTGSRARPSVSLCGRATSSQGLPGGFAAPLCSQLSLPHGSALHQEAHITPSLRRPGRPCAPGAASACCQLCAAQLPCHTSGGAGPGGGTGRGPVTYHGACVCLAGSGACWSRRAFAPRHVAQRVGGARVGDGVRVCPRA